MEIEHAIAEFGVHIGTLAVGQGIGMTSETKFKVGLVKRLVHFFGCGTLQQVVQLRTMRCMTCRTVAVGHRRMNRFSGKLGLVVTDHAEICPFCLEHILLIRLMGVVTTETLSFCNRLVGNYSVKLAFFVAGVAEFCSSGFQLELAVALVGIMAIETVTRGYRRVYMLFGIFTFVAFITEPCLTLIGKKKSFFFKLRMFLPGGFMA